MHLTRLTSALLFALLFAHFLTRPSVAKIPPPCQVEIALTSISATQRALTVTCHARRSAARLTFTLALTDEASGWEVSSPATRQINDEAIRSGERYQAQYLITRTRGDQPLSGEALVNIRVWLDAQTSLTQVLTRSLAERYAPPRDASTSVNDRGVLRAQGSVQENTQEGAQEQREIHHKPDQTPKQPHRVIPPRSTRQRGLRLYRGKRSPLKD